MEWTLDGASERMVAAIPEVAAEITKSELDGLHYLHFGALARFCQTAIDGGERALVQRCFDFADEAYRHGDMQVRNAVGVAFVEHLNLLDGKVPRQWAHEALSPALREAARSLGLERIDQRGWRFPRQR